MNYLSSEKDEIMCKNIIATSLFVAMVYLSPIACFADDSSANLQKNAIASFPEYFSQTDEFIVLGELFVNEHLLTCAFNKHFWGNGRMSGRILLFNNEGILLGDYGVISDEPKIIDMKLVFPFQEEDGNYIDFSNGIPDTVRLDGEIYNFHKITSGGQSSP
jgi:hypothetical protein